MSSHRYVPHCSRLDCFGAATSITLLKNRSHLGFKHVDLQQSSGILVVELPAHVQDVKIHCHGLAALCTLCLLMCFVYSLSF